MVATRPLRSLNTCPDSKKINDNASPTYAVETLNFSSKHNRNTSQPPPHHNGNRAAQVAADADNYKTAIACISTNHPVASIDHNNVITTIENLYSPPVPPLNLHTTPRTPLHSYHLPGNISHTICHATKNKGTG